MRSTPWALLLIAFAAAACDSPTIPSEEAPAFAAGANAIVASATGGGHYLLSGVLDVKFSFSAVGRADGSGKGEFRQSVVSNGLLIEFHGTVTCLSVDPANGRAWIGGVIKANTSVDPGFQGGIFDVGRDVWFRMLDDGEGRNAVDRTTFLGFEGGGGIATSAEYCAARIWPDENARTHPVTQGNIQVR